MFITKTRTAMENHDKLYKQFEEAARKEEQKDFARMEAVWNRVEEKLDRKEERRAAVWWKYTGIAAALLLFMSLGYILMQDEKHPLQNVSPATQEITTTTAIDTQAVQETIKPLKPESTVAFEDTEQKKVLDSKKQSIRSASETSRRVSDSVYYMHGTRFTTSKNADNTEYYFNTNKIKMVPGEKVVSGDTNMWIADAPKAESKEAATLADAVPVSAAPPVLNNNRLNTAIIEPSALYSNSLNKPGDKLYPFGKKLYNGIIKDEMGQPIPGVSVAVKGTTIAAATDFDGKFSLEAEKGNELDISYIGYNTERLKLEDKQTLEIAMNPSASELSEVVVIGYGTVKKSASRERKEREKQEKAALAATNVTAKSIEGRPNANFVQTLQGQAPGLSVTTGSGAPGSNNNVATNINYNPQGVRSEKGDQPANFKTAEKEKAVANKNIASPTGDVDKALLGRLAGVYVNSPDKTYGGNTSVVIRGAASIKQNNDPLYIVDGLPITSEAFRTINAKDIESISVLKDTAATAIYGSRAANGVIIITTKEGKNLSKKEIRKRNKKLKEQSKEAEQQRLEQQEADKKAYLDEQERLRNIRIPIDTEEYEAFEENKFESPASNPLSTFSIDVDNASYTNIRRFINNGQVVPKDAVRVEEMINFFKYNYPQPSSAHPFSINTEYSDCPWNPKHKLLKIGLQGKDIPAKELPSSNFVFLIDVSGSMNAQNKLPLLKESMKILVKNMRREDRIAIVVYAGAAGLVLPATHGDEKQTIIGALDKLSAGGSTAGGEGIELAYKIAQENFVKGGNNRVILATDGDFNVGRASNADMQTLIEEKRKSGVFLTCLGYGMGNYKDSKLETLSDKGNGNYAYIDNMQEADRFLDKEFKGSMYAIAKDVKIQIEFNPSHVQAYRLIGYENRKLRNEDFANDAIDAGELGSGHTVTALYEIIPPGVENDFVKAPELKYSQLQQNGSRYSSELATIKFRYKKPDGDKSTEIVHTIADTAVPMNIASGDFKFAAAVAWFGLKLRDSKLVPNKDTEAIKKLATEGLPNDTDGYRAEFIRLAGRIE
jgi:Ca-activated chloride channel homolog